jgi:acid phosphatase
MRKWLIVSFVVIVAAVAFAQVPASNHVVMVVEGNHSYASVIGNSAMPYLNSLASKYGLATHYYANTHPAIGNYFEMTTGQVLTSDNTMTPSNLPVSADNIVSEMMLAGKTWKSYAEGLPSVGYTGGNTGNYAVRNNPFAYFTEVQNSDTQKMNLVPFTQFATDLAANQLPDFSYVVPNIQNNGQSGSLQQADTWLKQNIAPLLADASFQQDGILIITFEESATTDKTHGGGQVATLVIGPQSKLGYKSTTLYQHQSLLRTVLTSLGASSAPGAAASAPLMSEFFTAQPSAQSAAQTNAALAKAATTTTGSVTISSPWSGATVSSPVQVLASAVSGNSSYPVVGMRLYVDSTLVYTVYSASMNTSQTLTPGAHTLTVLAGDASGKSYYKSINITVATATTGSVTITSPANGATVSSPTQFVASATANSGRTITAMQIYVDNVSVYSTSAASINTSLSLASGAHSVVIQAWDSAGTTYKTARNITVSGTGGTGTTAGTLAVSSSSLNFGSVSVGSTASQTVTLTASVASVTISQANITSSFAVNGLTLPLTLAAGKSASFSVQFTPTTSSTVNGSLSLVSNASTSTATVALSGTGTSSTSSGHSVAVSWSDSNSVNGFNVYRGSQSAGPYTKLTSSVVTPMTYTDSTVTSGATYYYAVTAVSSTGAESSYSTPVQAIVP